MKRARRIFVLRLLAPVLALVLAFAGLATASKTPPTHKIDINLAGAKELQELPGVGPTTAKAIIQMRTKSGRFHRVEDLLAIRGISETKLSKMRPYVIVSTSAAAPPAPSQKKSPPPAPAKPTPATQPTH